MPKIQLKPNSPEFADDDDRQRAAPDQCCEMPGCPKDGEYKAPKHRDLGQYYRFCLDHVQEYNKAWNYFADMSSSQIEEHIIRSALWDRPTWRYDSFANLESHLRQKAWQYYRHTHKYDGDSRRERESHREESERKRHEFLNKNAPEFEAMAIMGLEPPLELTTIKSRYKTLVKKYHPDINPDNPEAENLLKNINMAYTILKLAYEKYEKIKDKEPI